MNSKLNTNHISQYIKEFGRKRTLASGIIQCLLWCGVAAVPQTMADLATRANQDPAAMAAALVAGDVKPRNVVLTSHTVGSGSSKRTSTGMFSGGQDAPHNIGLPGGIILSTGGIEKAGGPNSSAGTATGYNAKGDDDLLQAIPGQYNDAASLAFDFTAQGSLARLQYVFASEEYPEYLNYPDAFAFLIKDLTADEQVYRNLALVPNTQLPVTVGTINGLTNANFYHDNNTLKEYNTEYDGFTEVLTASTPLVRGHAYSVKLVVADFNDVNGDSSVFIQGGSFTTLTQTDPPVIVEQPQSVEAVVGGKAQFEVTVAGPQPINIQWRWNGIPIPGATLSSLLLEHLTKTNSGNIDVVIANNFGSVSSQVVRLDVSTYAIWGDDRMGESSINGNLANPVATALGWYHDVAVYSDGTIKAWGDNSMGQLNVPAGLSNVVAVSAGAYHSLALKEDGTLAAWGWGLIGQTNLPAGLTNVVAISAGGFHNLALKSDGTIVTWGYNYYGQCSPPATLAKVKAISAGNFHSLALQTDGTVVAWGNNIAGQSTVPNGLNNVIGIAAGSYHNMVILADGTVTGWGDNRYMQLNVPAGLKDVVKVVCGDSHCLALKKDTTVVSWGHNQWLQSEVPEGLTDVKDISAGGDHSAIILTPP